MAKKYCLKEGACNSLYAGNYAFFEKGIEYDPEEIPKHARKYFKLSSDDESVDSNNEVENEIANQVDESIEDSDEEDSDDEKPSKRRKRRR